MFVRRTRGRRFRLSYEMNVHPGESLRQFRESLEHYVLPVRERVAPGARFAIAPRIGRGLLEELSSRRARESLRDELDDLGLIPFTINAFPLEDFHAKRVKESVYSPPWTRAVRATLTNRVADWQSSVLDETEVGTISTLGGTYRPWGNGAQDLRRIAKNYLKVVAHLARIRLRTGRTIVLCAEPEPDTTLETADDVIDLVEGFMLPALKASLAKPLGLSGTRAEEVFRDHFAVNLDVCHQSVLFRDPVREWKALEGKGIRVAKLHLTNALALRNPARSPRGLQALRSYDEPRYLHQFAARLPDGSLLRGADLPALKKRSVGGAEEIRCHFHVPLSRARMGPLHTTRDDTSRALRYALQHPDPPHLVIETYTWPILARRARSEFLAGSIVREFRWVLAQMH